MTLMELIDAEMAEYSNGAYADHGSARDQLERFYTIARADLEAEIAGWKADQKENLANQCELQAEINQLRKERQAFKDVTEYQKAENARFRLALEKIANFTDRPINTAREALGETK